MSSFYRNQCYTSSVFAFNTQNKLARFDLLVLVGICITMPNYTDSRLN